MADDGPQISVEHLKLVQNVVTRMAGNSTQMKTWAISLATATFVFSGLSKNPHWLIGLGGCIPVIAFWTMDARYLQLERCYVKLYDAIINGAQVKPFDLDYDLYIAGEDSIWRIAWSWSVCRFYGALLVLMIALVGILIGGT